MVERTKHTEQKQILEKMYQLMALNPTESTVAAVQQALEEANSAFADAPTEVRVTASWQVFGDQLDQILLTTSGGKTSAFLPHYLAEVLDLAPENFSLVFINTQLHPQPTWDQVAALAAAGFQIQVLKSGVDWSTMRNRFPPDWSDDPNHRETVSQLLKVGPLNAFIADHSPSAWIKALRRGDTTERGQMQFLELDERGVLTCNPFLDWTTEQVLTWLQARNLPVNMDHRDPLKNNGQGQPKAECGIHTQPNSVRQVYTLKRFSAE